MIPQGFPLELVRSDTKERFIVIGWIEREAWHGRETYRPVVADYFGESRGPQVLDDDVTFRVSIPGAGPSDAT